MVEHTNLAPASDYGGESVVYVSAYADPASPEWRLKDDEVFARFASGLKRVYPSFDDGAVTWRRVARTRYATPVFKIGFRRLLDNLSAVLPPGLFLAGNLVIYPGSRNVSSVISSGARSAEAVAAHIGHAALRGAGQ